jgi:hypothetical protein
MQGMLKEFIHYNKLFLYCYEFSFHKCTATLEADVAEVRSLLYITSLLQNWQLNRHYYIHVRHTLQYSGNKNQLHTSPDALAYMKLDLEILATAMANITTVQENNKQLILCYKLNQQVNNAGDKTQRNSANATICERLHC